MRRKSPRLPRKKIYPQIYPRPRLALYYLLLLLLSFIYNFMFVAWYLFTLILIFILLPTVDCCRVVKFIHLYGRALLYIWRLLIISFWQTSQLLI